jgi:MYXO-CTERM domain-containing protein
VKLTSNLKALGVIALLLQLSLSMKAGTATSVTGLYYTGSNNTGGLVSGGTTDPHWSVTYASVNGTNYTGTSAYSGSSYVVSGSYIDGGWAPNTSTAQWITAPGATNSGGAVNVGGDTLPGTGTTGTNAAQYVYRLAFTIGGIGTGAVTNKVSISLTMAADDQYAVYVNPTLNANGSVKTTSTAVGSGGNAWSNTSAVYAQNFVDSNGTANSAFVIGTNYIYVVVDNTNSQTGTVSTAGFNASGLLVYQVGAATTIDGKPIPEVGAWLPLAVAFGVFGWRRRRSVFPTA